MRRDHFPFEDRVQKQSHPAILSLAIAKDFPVGCTAQNMPQATLKAYFAPIQSSVAPQPSCVSSAALQVFDNSASAVASTEDHVEKNSLVNGSILDSIESDAFSSDRSDFFVPTHQPSAAIVKVLPSYLARLKNITATLLPVRYPDKFFNECVEIESVSDLSRVLLWNSQPVGWIRCRLETDDHGLVQAYIQALGVLGPYRGAGLATCLLNQVMKPQTVQKHSIKSVYCHVWESNEDALEWYEKRGFRRVILQAQYYRRLKPSGAWTMRMDTIKT